MSVNILPSYAEGGDPPTIVSPVSPDAEYQQLQRLEGEFDIELLPIEDLTPSVIPFHAQSVEEVREILQFLNDPDEVKLPTAIERELPLIESDMDGLAFDPISDIDHNDASMAPTSIRFIATRKCSRRVGLARFNVAGDFLVDRYSKRIIRVTHTRAYMSGWTWGVGLKNPYSYPYNVRSYRASVRGGGTAQAYILLNNRFLTFYQAPVSCHFTYHSR